MLLTEHFTLEELTRSARARQASIDNSPPPSVIDALHETACMLESARAHLSHLAGRDVPILITSGYRCARLNRLVGGVMGGPHTTGEASDILAPEFGTPAEVAKALAPHISTLGIGQLILERKDGKVWVHLGTRAPQMAANRVITITDTHTEFGIKEAT